MEPENPHYDGGKPFLICKLSTIRTTPAGGGEVFPSQSRRGEFPDPEPKRPL